MRDKIYKYKGYKIEKDFDHNGRMTLWTATPQEEFISQRAELEKQKISRVWHGNDCFCSDCTYTEQDHKHNSSIEEQIKSLIFKRKCNSITCNTMKECKFEIDSINN